jgi:hypothetical protein
MYIPSKLFVSGDAAATAQNIAAHELLFRSGIVGDLVCGVILIFLTLALYRLFEGVSRYLAVLVVVLGGVLPATIDFLNTVNDGAALMLATGADFLSTFDEPQRQTLALLFIRLHQQIVVGAEILWGLWLLPLGMLTYRSGFMPRFIGVWLIINGATYVVISFTGLLAPQYYGRVFNLAFPALLGEVAFMLWLVIRGVTDDARRAGVRHAAIAAVAVMISMPMLLAGAPAARADLLDSIKDIFSKSPAEQGTLSQEEIGDGLKEALLVGTRHVISRLGRTDGFNADPEIHIPLPDSLKKVQSMLGKVGMSDMLDDLELRLNRAAELATPKAKALFVQAIHDLTLKDVMQIYKGPDDAATRYFQDRMSAPLAGQMTPIVQQSLSDAGAVQAFQKVMERYDALPFAPRVDTDLSGYVVERGMDGIFHYVAKEEAAIRKDPAKQTTDLLKRVFGRASG